MSYSVQLRVDFFSVTDAPWSVRSEDMCDGWNTLYINTVVGEEEEEAEDDEMQPWSVPVPKMPLGRLLDKLIDND